MLQQWTSLLVTNRKLMTERDNHWGQRWWHVCSEYQRVNDSDRCVRVWSAWWRHCHVNEHLCGDVLSFCLKVLCGDVIDTMTDAAVRWRHWHVTNALVIASSFTTTDKLLEKYCVLRTRYFRLSPAWPWLLYTNSLTKQESIYPQTLLIICHWCLLIHQNSLTRKSRLAYTNALKMTNHELWPLTSELWPVTLTSHTPVSLKSSSVPEVCTLQLRWRYLHQHHL